MTRISAVAIVAIVAIAACGSKDASRPVPAAVPRDAIVADDAAVATEDAMTRPDAGADTPDTTTTAMTPAELASAEGTWRIPPLARSRRSGNTGEGPGTTRFKLEKDTVTLYLLTEKEWMWKSADDHYRVKAQWVGHELQYLPPFGRWELLATFRADHFEGKGLTAPWIYERVTNAMKDQDDRILDRPRKLHDYRIKPMDPR